MADYLIQQREYLLEISRALTSQLSLNEVLRRVLYAATQMLDGQAGLLALADAIDEEEDEVSFSVRASYGIDPKLLHFFAPLLADISHGSADSFFIPKLKQKVRVVAKTAGLGLHQVVALPMAIGQELVGVVYIFRGKRQPFTQNDLQLLQAYADQAAIAVHNARLYEQVSTEKQRLDALLRYSADGIMILKPTQRIESINLALARMTGWDPQEASNEEYHQVINWARREPGMDLAEAMHNGWPLHQDNVLYVEGDLRRKDSSTLSVGITYAPLFDAKNRLHNIIANVRDITKFREAEEAKSTFVSVISHELKTPVALIKGYASTLRRDDVMWDKETTLDGLAIIEEEADRLAEMIENLLDVTRVQSGTLSLQFSTVRLPELVGRLVRKFRVQTDQHTIESRFPADFPDVQVDERRLGQVLSNLISNAIKYSPDGGHILVSGSRLDRHVEIRISDEGIGMEPEQLSRVFDRFYRADNALTRQTQGVGLGLYIVRSIIKAHDGTITVESVPKVGTTFIIQLPLSER
ncbi:MAG: GAF domain-containing protein [Chloroflexi bacterium]|nr:GAF domain-containing protein [Chloroflexota bacterium]